MQHTSPLRYRIAAAGATTILSLAVASWIVGRRSGSHAAGTALIVDHADAFQAMLERRYSEGRAAAAEADPTRLLLDEADRELLRLTYFRERKGFVTDPLLFYRRASHIDRWQTNPEHPGGRHRVRTNDLGMRNDEDVLPQKPDLRILVTGDSHTEGVCENADSFTSLLGRELRVLHPERRIEALNAGTGGYDFYHYLGVLQRYADLHPDVFVVVVYGGNDFFASVKFQRFFLRRPPAARGPHGERNLEAAGLKSNGLGPQEMTQLVYFLDNPEDIEQAIVTARVITREMQASCEEWGIQLVCAYLPPPLRGQPHHYPERVAALARFLGDRGGERDPSDRIADGWIEFLRAEGILHADLRPAFRAAQDHLYWKRDAHIDLEGHALVAAELLPQVRAALERQAEQR